MLWYDPTRRSHPGQRAISVGFTYAWRRYRWHFSFKCVPYRWDCNQLMKMNLLVKIMHCWWIDECRLFYRKVAVSVPSKFETHKKRRKVHAILVQTPFQPTDTSWHTVHMHIFESIAYLLNTNSTVRWIISLASDKSHPFKSFIAYMKKSSATWQATLSLLV